MKGWFKDRYRHSLSSRGIPTTCGKLQKFHRSVEVEKDIPPKPDYETILENYHGYYGYDKLKEFGKKVTYRFWWCSLTDNWDFFDFDKAIKSIKRVFWKYINHDETFMDENGELSDRYYKYDWGWQLENMIDAYRRTEDYRPSISQHRKIELFDSLIHTVHSHGNVFNINIDELRKDFEEEYL